MLYKSKFIIFLKPSVAIPEGGKIKAKQGIIITLISTLQWLSPY